MINDHGIKDEVLQMMFLLRKGLRILNSPHPFQEPGLIVCCHPIHGIEQFKVFIHYCPIKPFTDRKKSFSA